MIQYCKSVKKFQGTWLVLHDWRCWVYSQSFIQSPYFLTFMEPRNRFQGMNSASLWSLAGRYDNPIPPRFLALIDSLKIPAQYANFVLTKYVQRNSRNFLAWCKIFFRNKSVVLSRKLLSTVTVGAFVLFMMWWKSPMASHSKTLCYREQPNGITM